MNIYMIKFSDGTPLRVQASNADMARNRAYNIYRSGTIASVDKV